MLCVYLRVTVLPSLSWRGDPAQHNVQPLAPMDEVFVNANFATQRIAVRLAHVLYPSLLTEVWLFVIVAMFALLFYHSICCLRCNTYTCSYLIRCPASCSVLAVGTRKAPTRWQSAGNARWQANLSS